MERLEGERPQWKPEVVQKKTSTTNVCGMRWEGEGDDTKGRKKVCRRLMDRQKGGEALARALMQY